MSGQPVLLSPEDVFQYLEGFLNLERGGYEPREYRLERMEKLLNDFDNPQLAYPVMHVAGSKGKGSVSTYATSCLHETGMRVGTYLSPHVSSYRERIQLSGVAPGSSYEELVVSAGRTIQEYVQELSSQGVTSALPTTFELLTLLSFLVFRAAEVDAAVIEVGLGGRLDATNLVKPQVCVITHIELEHTDYLGNTLQSVAREKGGIIKPGVPVVLAPQSDDVNQILRGIADERGCRVIRTDRDVVDCGPMDLGGNEVTIRYSDGFLVKTHLRAPGRIHAVNAATAVAAVRVMLPGISPDAVASALGRTWLPGRAEVLPGPPPILLDGAHTPSSVAAVAEATAAIEPDREKRVLIFGAVEGKNHRAMIETLISTFPKIIVSKPGTFKPSDTEGLTRLCQDAGGECLLKDDMGDAIAHARSLDPGIIVVTGSFYLVGEARSVLAGEEN
jgi:dihydrofolate synthase/folylpolyglutamate synthase